MSVFRLAIQPLAQLQLVVCTALVVSCSTPTVSAPASGASPAIPMEILRPEGPGPFPAVVVLHACNGIGGQAPKAWARRLLALGYVTIVPDSFTPRGYPAGVCGNGMEVPAEVRARDAYAGLHILEQRPDVISDHIGLIGFSHGGWTVVATMNLARSPLFKPPGVQHEFRAAIALYPFCPDDFATRTTYVPSAPMLILAGELDDWTPAAPCEALARRSGAAGLPVSIKVYPGAYHAFDSALPVTFVPVARRGLGAHVGGNPVAREDAIVQVREFFGRTLQTASGAQ